jgi:outer membrane receptor protein involved in Fe transport
MIAYSLRQLIRVFFFVFLTGLFFHLPVTGKGDKRKEDPLDRVFDMSLEDLLEVKVNSAARIDEKIADIPASVVLITRDEIESYGYSNLAEILANIPGLFMIDDYGEGGANFGVRGFWSGQTNDNMIIMVNGVPHIHDFYSNYALDKIAVPVEAIDRIEVIRGPMSVIYGSGAFFGVVNIITDKPKPGNDNILSTSYGSNHSKKIVLRLSGQKGDVSYAVNASFFETSGLDIAFNDLVSDPSTLLPVGVEPGSSTRDQLEDQQRFFNLSASFKDVSVHVSHSSGIKEFSFAFPSLEESSTNHLSGTHLGVKYLKSISSHLSLEANFTYSRNKDRFKYRILFEDFYGIELLESEGIEAAINVFWKPTRQFSLVAGLNQRSILDALDMFDLPSFGVPDLEHNYISIKDNDAITVRSLFIQAKFSPFRQLKLVAGMRLEQTPAYSIQRIHTMSGGQQEILSGQYKETGIEIIPRLAILFSPDQHNTFKFLYGKAINRPSFAQNNWNMVTPHYPVLKPEQIQTIEFNYLGRLSPRLTVNAGLFKNVLNRLITRVVKFDAELNYESWSANAGKMVTHGIEFTLKAEPLKYLRIEFSSIYQHTRDKRLGFEQIPLAYSPKFLGYFKGSYLGKGFRLGITGNYVAGMETFWDETRLSPSGSLGARIGDKSNAYFLLSANLRIDGFLWKGGYLAIHCWNLLDEEIRYPTFTNNEWADRGTLAGGRRFMVSLGYRF